jgi:hypothetical protein
VVPGTECIRTDVLLPLLHACHNNNKLGLIDTADDLCVLYMQDNTYMAD